MKPSFSQNGGSNEAFVRMVDERECECQQDNNEREWRRRKNANGVLILVLIDHPLCLIWGLGFFELGN